MKIIGGGGFASVWRARSAGPGGFERAVAIKVIRPARARLKRFQDMLLDEARLVARIQHPNVTQIWEVGEDPRSIYVVMELVEGASLDELRERAEAQGATLPLGAVFRVLADICGGLHAAHELGGPTGESLGLVHRDVSPQNILVSSQGVAKLIDFGIAKARERLSSDTTTGLIKGKVSFMAPEQARGGEIDRRADVWAIGAVAFDLIEGRPPVAGENDVSRLGSLVSADVVPPLRDDVPAPLRAVVARALEKDPSRRHATAAALKEAIEAALIESELETSPEDVALLLRRYFDESTAAFYPRAVPDAAETGVSTTVERPVRSPSATLLLPLEPRRPLWIVAGLALLAAPIAWWALRSPELDLAPRSSGVTSSPSDPTHRDQSPVAAASAAATPQPVMTSLPVLQTSASARSAPSVAPPVPGRRSAGGTRPLKRSKVDEDAIE